MRSADVDVAVIGGGLAGAAVLRDLARRGARAVLFEKDDLAHGGSRAGFGTIDTADLGVDSVDEAARSAREREAAILATTAPHLAMRVPVLSISSGPKRGASLLAGWDAMLALRSRTGKSVDRTALDAASARTREAALVLDDDLGAIATQRIRLDAHRLALAWARDATEQDAELRLHEGVIGLKREGELVRLETRSGTMSARAVVLATGAWPMPGAPPRAKERRIHLVLEHAITTHAIVTEHGSLVPFHNASLVTSVARAFDGEPDDASVSRDEVRMLIARLGSLVPDLREARVNAAYASVRRTASESVEPPLYVVPMGTPWDARARAEELGARIAKALELTTPSATATAKVPGGEEVVDSFVVAERLAIPEPTARRIVLRQGARFADIGARIGRRRTEAAVVCACEPVLEAEVRHAVRVEHARDVCDVGRRTQLGFGACGGMRCAHRAAEIVCAERALPPSEAHAMTRRFLLERWQERAPALDATSLAQEELAHARWTAASMTRDRGSAE